MCHECDKNITDRLQVLESNINDVRSWPDHKRRDMIQAFLLLLKHKGSDAWTTDQPDLSKQFGFEVSPEDALFVVLQDRFLKAAALFTVERERHQLTHNTHAETLKNIVAPATTNPKPATNSASCSNHSDIKAILDRFEIAVSAARLKPSKDRRDILKRGFDAANMVRVMGIPRDVADAALMAGMETSAALLIEREDAKAIEDLTGN